MTERPRVIIIAGPNGAGKTTFARSFLPAEASDPTFVNTDLIAAGLAPFDPPSAALQAGRVMLSEPDRHFHGRASFSFETVDAWTLYDGSGATPVLVDWGKNA